MTSLFLFNALYVDQNFWFDPTPNKRTDIAIPLTQVGFLSIVLHEFGHGLGYAGYLDRFPGNNCGKYISGLMTAFDDISSFGRDGNALDTATGNPNPMFFDSP